MTKRIVSGIFVLAALGALGVILAGALTTGEQLIVRFLTSVIVAGLGLYVISDLRLQASRDADQSTGSRRATPAPGSTAAYMASVTTQHEQRSASRRGFLDAEGTEDRAEHVATRPSLRAATSAGSGWNDPSSAARPPEPAPSETLGANDVASSATPPAVVEIIDLGDGDQAPDPLRAPDEARPHGAAPHEADGRAVEEEPQESALERLVRSTINYSGDLAPPTTPWPPVPSAQTGGEVDQAANPTPPAEPVVAVAAVPPTVSTSEDQPVQPLDPVFDLNPAQAEPDRKQESAEVSTPATPADGERSDARLQDEPRTETPTPEPAQNRDRAMPQTFEEEATLIDLRKAARHDEAAVARAIRAGEADVIRTLIKQGMLTTSGPITDRDVRTMVYVAFTSNELRKLIMAGGSPDDPRQRLDLGPVELFDERKFSPAPRTFYTGLVAPSPETVDRLPASLGA